MKKFIIMLSPPHVVINYENVFFFFKCKFIVTHLQLMVLSVKRKKHIFAVQVFCTFLQLLLGILVLIDPIVAETPC